MQKLILIIVMHLVVTPYGFTTSLYDENRYKAYTSDYRAHLVGDVVTLLIYENSQATANSGVAGDRSIGAGLNFNTNSNSEVGNLDFGVNEEGGKSTNRQGNLRAQISAVVEEIDENGRMKISGSQEIVVNNDSQVIKVKGWIRPVDIAKNNTVISTRLTDAYIEYKGDGLDGLGTDDGIIRKAGDIIMWVPKKALDITSWLLGVL